MKDLRRLLRCYVFYRSSLELTSSLQVVCSLKSIHLIRRVVVELLLFRNVAAHSFVAAAAAVRQAGVGVKDHQEEENAEDDSVNWNIVDLHESFVHSKTGDPPKCNRENRDEDQVKREANPDSGAAPPLAVTLRQYGWGRDESSFDTSGNADELSNVVIDSKDELQR